jgi:hypothetical protein
MNPIDEFIRLETRRQFFGQIARGIGSTALAALLNGDAFGSTTGSKTTAAGGLPGLPNFAPRARRVIFLFMAGAPSQMDMFDYKPKLVDWFSKDLPESVRQGQRLTTQTAAQAHFPIAPSIFKFNRYGQCGAPVSELLPHTAKMVDDVTFIKTMWTEAINHDPAITYVQTGNQIPGRPSLGAWISYGLGSVNRDLPDFVVLTSTFSSQNGAQALFSRLWGSGFLPSSHAGVDLRSQGDPVLYLANPSGVDRQLRREMLDALGAMNRRVYDETCDPETHSRIDQYEMAFRMQKSVPDLVDLSSEPQHVLDMYGPDVHKPGTFAYNCLLARRMAERDVRFVQIFHRGWDQHLDLPNEIKGQCRDVDQGAWALVQDLKQRGMLKDTLVVWGGEFGRTVYSQGQLTNTSYGRDHHPRCFTMWMAGGGVRSGYTHGETDDFSYNIVRDPVHIHDLNATILYLLGIDHHNFTVRNQGLDMRLTGVEPAKVVHEIVS